MSVGTARWRPVTYWATTTIVVAESLIGGAADLLRLDPFYPLLIQLGYPSYLATILGAAKILGGLVIATPRLPRLKEWAYAGIMINMVGAAASHLATGGHVDDYIPPLTFAALALTSWHLRPATRRLGHDRTQSGREPATPLCAPTARRVWLLPRPCWLIRDTPCW